MSTWGSKVLPVQHPTSFFHCIRSFNQNYWEWNLETNLSKKRKCWKLGIRSTSPGLSYPLPGLQKQLLLLPLCFSFRQISLTNITKPFSLTLIFLPLKCFHFFLLKNSHGLPIIVSSSLMFSHSLIPKLKPSGDLKLGFDWFSPQIIFLPRSSELLVDYKSSLVMDTSIQLGIVFLVLF